MTTVGIAMAKDEIDVLEGTLRHMADETDSLLVADNGSTDGTRELLDELAKDLPLVVVDDPEVGFRQSEKMSALAERAAAELGATRIVPFDLDELWYSRHGRVREVLADTEDWVVAAQLHHHIRTGADLDDPDPFRSMIWRQDQPAKLPKVAFRWSPGAVLAQGNHSVYLPSAPAAKTAAGLLEICHFPVRSLSQYHRKAINGGAAYAAAPDIQGGDHWKSWAALSEAQREEAYRTWWHFPNPTEVGMWHDVGLMKEPPPYMRWRG